MHTILHKRCPTELYSPIEGPELEGAGGRPFFLPRRVKEMVQRAKLKLHPVKKEPMLIEFKPVEVPRAALIETVPPPAVEAPMVIEVPAPVSVIQPSKETVTHWKITRKELPAPVPVIQPEPQEEPEDDLGSILRFRERQSQREAEMLAEARKPKLTRWQKFKKFIFGEPDTTGEWYW